MPIFERKHFLLICRISKSVSNDPTTLRYYLLKILSYIQYIFLTNHYALYTPKYTFIFSVANSIKNLQCLQAKQKFSHAEVVYIPKCICRRGTTRQKACWTCTRFFSEQVRIQLGGGSLQPDFVMPRISRCRSQITTAKLCLGEGFQRCCHLVRHAGHRVSCASD